MAQGIFGKLREFLKGGTDESLTYADIEADIQSRAKYKDPEFKLRGDWIEYLYKHNGYRVYRVNGEWVRNNLSMMFGHGGHGYVHEFIKTDEIWVASRHFPGCGCEFANRGPKDRIMSKAFEKSVILHEMIESEEMKRGRSFRDSHDTALEAEIRMGYLDKADEFNPEPE